MSAVTLCSPQKSSISWVSRMPPIIEPEIFLRANSKPKTSRGNGSAGAPTNPGVPSRFSRLIACYHSWQIHPYSGASTPKRWVSEPMDSRTISDQIDRILHSQTFTRKSQLRGALLITGAMLQVGCGGGRSTGVGSHGGPGTPAGNYTITVTATSGANTHSTTLINPDAHGRLDCANVVWRLVLGTGCAGQVNSENTFCIACPSAPA